MEKDQIHKQRQCHYTGIVTNPISENDWEQLDAAHCSSHCKTFWHTYLACTWVLCGGWSYQGWTINVRAKVVDVGDTICCYVQPHNWTGAWHCLEAILKLEKELKEHYLLGFIVNQVANPEIKIIFIFRKYGIIIEHNQISLSQTFLKYKYPVPIYRFMVIKMRAQIVKYLMRELLVSLVGILQQPNSLHIPGNGRIWP